MSLKEFAESELRRAGAFDKDGDYMGEIGPAVMKMVEVFAEEGHSGFSASLAINMFERVARFEPLTPLTGADDEWYDPAEGCPDLQNTRCPRVFKNKTSGETFDIEGKVFREPSGACFTSLESRVPVTFPYVPTREYVEVQAR